MEGYEDFTNNPDSALSEAYSLFSRNIKSCRILLFSRNRLASLLERDLQKHNSFSTNYSSPATGKNS